MEVRMIRAMAQAVQPKDLNECRRELGDIAMVQSILAGLEVRVLRAMRDYSSDTEGEHAQATRSSSRKSSKAKKRADAADQIPQLEDALNEGETTSEHVDVVAETLASLSAADRERLAAHGDAIRVKAASVGEREFRRWLQQLVRRLRQDDAAARLARQKGACRASRWLDQEGMWNVRGRFDPETGARLQATIKAATDKLAQGQLADGAPEDLGERRLWLQAAAVARLIDGEAVDSAGAGAGAGAGAEMLIVIDAETLLHGEHDRTVLDVCGFDLPLDTIRRWACTMAITPVIVGLDGTRLMLGRTTRLASADQRRALAVLHRTCACCDSPFDRCQIHHVDWWEHGGPTDINKLLPLCPHCHHLVHDCGWTIELHADRSVTLIGPNGERREHPPPRVWAA